MGLTKQYLRYAHKETFGIIGSHQSNISFVNFRKTVGRYVAVGACEDVIIWDLRSRAKVTPNAFFFFFFAAFIYFFKYPN